MSILSQIIDVNCKNKLDENLAITDLHLQVDTKGYGSASFSQAAIDTLIRRGEELAMRHWDDIIALKKRIGIDDSFHPVILNPTHPQVMTEKQHVARFEFENMTPQDEVFLRQKFNLNKTDSIDASLEQELTTSMRIDPFYQTAERRLTHTADGVRVTLSAGNRKSVQLHAGVRFDSEENAALQFELGFPLKSAMPLNADFTIRLGKGMMVRGEITAHPRNFTRPTLSYTFWRNDVDIYKEGDLDYNIRYNQTQAEFLPINHSLGNFNIQAGLRWDYMHYRSKLGSDNSRLVSLKNEHFISYRARLDFNNEDNWYFPTRGTRFKVEYAYITNNFTKLNAYAEDGSKQGKKNGMSELNANWRSSFPLNSRFSLQPMLYGRMLFGSVVPPVFGNTIGGDWFGHYVEQQMPFAGLHNMEYLDRKVIAAQLQAQEHIGSSYILLRVAAAQQANQVRNLLDNRTLIGGQIAYYYNTIAGPVGLSIGYCNHTKDPYIFLNLGYEF